MRNPTEKVTILGGPRDGEAIDVREGATALNIPAAHPTLEPASPTAEFPILTLAIRRRADGRLVAVWPKVRP